MYKSNFGFLIPKRKRNMTAQPALKCIVHVVIHILLKKALKYKVLVDYG